MHAVPSITIRDVPAAVRDELAARAARSGRSLQEYLSAQLINLASRPAADDVLARARERALAGARNVSIAEILAARNDARRD